MWVCGAAVFAVVLTAFGSSVRAGPLATDENAMEDYRGTEHYYCSGPDFTLDTDVDYAVYAPGDYPGGYEPVQENDYVYAYQILNTEEGTVDIMSFSIALKPGSGADNAGDDTSDTAPGQAGGQSPNFSTIGATSVGWLFYAPHLLPDEYSTTLVFTSPNAPVWVNATVMDSGISDTEMLPSAIPEPASVALMIFGAAALAVGSRRRKK